MKLQNNNISIEVCEKSGATTGIFALNDSMNWVLENSDWGLVDGFETREVENSDNVIMVKTFSKKRNIEIVIEKKVTDNEYFETYYITNKHTSEVFLTKENFGITFPYDCLYDLKRDFMNDCCISHVWCGGDNAWIYSIKCAGYGPYLVMNVTEGAVDDYSIKYDVSRTGNGSFYRGAIMMHPRECLLMPNESKKVSFRYSFKAEKPEKAPLDYKGAIRFTADKYSMLENEEISLLFESESGFSNLKITCEGKEIEYKKSGNNATATVSFDSLGERKISAEVDGKKTWINVNVILPVDEILQRRAKFIAEKQQYHCEGSHLDGAYLIYDCDTESKYYDSDWSDHNASRERLAMGVVVCKAIQAKYDEKLMTSLKKHREFIEREIFDSETGMVYDQICEKKEFTRIYNFPWVSTYYLEWYNLTGEIKCLENSAKILIRFFENTDCELDAQCMEIYNICKALEKEGLVGLYNRLLELFLTFIDKIGEDIAEHDGHVNETSYVSEHPNIKLCAFAHALLLTGDQKYRKGADDYFVKTKAFFGSQPDFHLNSVNVRYWDRYWFGKNKSYGDLFPHYWASLAGWGMHWYDKATNSNIARELTVNNLTGNLCVYRPDGFAHNNYLYPYKVIQYSKTGEIKDVSVVPGVFYGKNYDSFANDQDWALYYASTIL